MKFLIYFSPRGGHVDLSGTWPARCPHLSVHGVRINSIKRTIKDNVSNISPRSNKPGRRHADHCEMRQQIYGFPQYLEVVHTAVRWGEVVCLEEDLWERTSSWPTPRYLYDWYTVMCKWATHLCFDVGQGLRVQCTSHAVKSKDGFEKKGNLHRVSLDSRTLGLWEHKSQVHPQKREEERTREKNIFLSTLEVYMGEGPLSGCSFLFPSIVGLGPWYTTGVLDFTV